ncbi:HET-domain-containing protein, partial [Glonium stellatum]
PGKDNDELDLELVVHYLMCPPEYDALSYCWGTDAPTVKVEFPADGEFVTTLIRPNLAAAIRRLRLPDRARFVWVDAICINQTDDKEKSLQIPKMATIYERATRVCVWLGEEKDDSALALSFIKNDMLDLGQIDALVNEKGTERAWTALSKLMRRPWFSRRWIIQEIVYAKEAILYCGNDAIDWTDFADAVTLFADYEIQWKLASRMKGHRLLGRDLDYFSDVQALGATRLVEATSNLFRYDESWRVTQKFRSLEYLVSSLSVFKASQPHDTIYAIMGLAKDYWFLEAPSKTQSAEGEPLEQPQVYEADYSKPAHIVFQDFVDFVIRTSKSLDIICRPWAPDDIEQLPSWITTLKAAAFETQTGGRCTRINADSLVGLPGIMATTYNASGSRLPVWNIESISSPGQGIRTGHSLIVQGVMIDTVQEVKLPAHEGIVPSDWLEFGGWTDRSAAPPEELWRTLVANRGPDGTNMPTYYRRACKHALLHGLEGGGLHTNRILAECSSSIVAKFLRRVQAAAWMRRLCKTTTSTLGLVPKNTREGDLICILYGCSVPVILRKIECDGLRPEACSFCNRSALKCVYNHCTHELPKKEFYYKFIGECYVSGKMD